MPISVNNIKRKKSMDRPSEPIHRPVEPIHTSPLAGEPIRLLASRFGCPAAKSGLWPQGSEHHHLHSPPGTACTTSIAGGGATDLNLTPFFPRARCHQIWRE